MDKRDYGAAEVWRDCLGALSRPGLLLAVAGPEGRANAMTIGWAQLGILWGLPVLSVFVRPSRYTYGLLEEAMDFTVNVPDRGMEEVVEFCGRVSGRDHDKLAERGLTAAPARRTRSPILAECLLHYECRVVQRADILPEAMTSDAVQSFYPQGDYHRVYFGEVLAVYGVPDLAERLHQVRL